MEDGVMKEKEIINVTFNCPKCAGKIEINDPFFLLNFLFASETVELKCIHCKQIVNSSEDEDLRQFRKDLPLILFVGAVRFLSEMDKQGELEKFAENLFHDE